MRMARRAAAARPRARPAHQDGVRLRDVHVVLVVQPVAAARRGRRAQHESDDVDPHVLRAPGARPMARYLRDAQALPL